MLKDLFCHRGTETQNYFSEGYLPADFADNAEKIEIKIFLF
jgi:hypothetical protein